MFFEMEISFCFLAEIDIIPVGSNLVKLWGVEAGLFLMIDDAGQLRGTVSLLFRIYRRTMQGIRDVNLGGTVAGENLHFPLLLCHITFILMNNMSRDLFFDRYPLNFVIHWFIIFDHI